MANCRRRGRTPPHKQLDSRLAKENLVALPVVPNGVEAVTIGSVLDVTNAVLTYSKNFGAGLRTQRAQRIGMAGLWVLYRCTAMTQSEIAKGNGLVSVHMAIKRIDHRLRVGNIVARSDVDGILCVLAGRTVQIPEAALSNACRRAVTNTQPKAVVDGLDETTISRIDFYRRKKWSVYGIHKHTGIDLSAIAAVCGVELNLEKA